MVLFIVALLFVLCNVRILRNKKTNGRQRWLIVGKILNSGDACQQGTPKGNQYRAEQ
jgi:hypothetical protein